MIPGVYDCDSVKQMIQSGAKLIDVRTPAEFAQGALQGAVNVPLQTIPMSAGQFSPDETLLLYCRSGSRSMFAKQYLERMGFTDVHNIGSIQSFIHCA